MPSSRVRDYQSSSEIDRTVGSLDAIHGREDNLPTRTPRTEFTRRDAIADGQLLDITDAATKIVHDIVIPTAITHAAWKALQGSQRSSPRADYLGVLKALQAARTVVLGRLPELGRTPFDVRVGRRSHRFAIEIHASDDDGELVATIMVDRPRSRRGSTSRSSRPTPSRTPQS